MNIIFKKSTRKNKKYMAILPNGKTVHFGDNRYEQYTDSTGMGLYSHLDHKDNKRRSNYKKRHKKGPKYSASWFAWTYLW